MILPLLDPNPHLSRRFSARMTDPTDRIRESRDEPDLRNATESD
jgi:hypothetical protein